MTIRQVSLAPVREGLEPGTPFSVNILALDDPSALHTCDQLSAAEPTVPAPVCLADQRRRVVIHSIVPARPPPSTGIGGSVKSG